MIKTIIAIAAIILLSLPELLQAEQRRKTFFLFFILIGISLVLGLFINIDKQPTSPSELFMNFFKSAGLSEG